jgi:Trm5-related predicted tRNA methylase
MGSLSIRGINDQLASVLKEKAASSKKSVNQFVLDTLKKQVGLAKQKKFTQEYHDLDELFGCWSSDEHDKIQAKISSERHIDEELWK